MSSEIEHPVAPENVRIVRSDGAEIPCEVRYAGVTIADDGKPIHRWEVISEYVPQIPQDKIAIDMLPARTQIVLVMRGPEADAG